MNCKMSKVWLHFFVVTYICGYRSKSVLAQIVPETPCPEYFQYLNTGDGYVGKITISNLQVATTKVEVQLSLREQIMGLNGRLTLFEDLQTTQSNLENGYPITYRVDFPNPHTLPKLMRIAVNGRTICSGSGLPPPSITFTLYHTFVPSAITPFKSTRFSSTPTRTMFNSIPNFNDNDDEFFQQFLQDSLKDENIFVPSDSFFPQTSLRPTGFRQNSFNQAPRESQTQKPRMSITEKPSSPTVDNRFKANVACGQEGGGLTPFIVGGREYPRGKFPWLTAIYIRHGADLRFTCGGSLISSRTIITAAHCFLDSSITADRVVPYLGRHNLFSTEDGVVQCNIASLVKHPEFNPSILPDADVALLNMRESVAFSNYIRPICLWSQTSNVDNVANQKAFVAGWGSNNKNYDVTPMPQLVETTIVDEVECLRSPDVNRELATSRTICAGNRDGTGPCSGDSGGALMMSVGGSWMIRGIVSGGRTQQGKCNLNDFVFYCDIAKHISWIKEKMLQ